jgi:hypothetical protein
MGFNGGELAMTQVPDYGKAPTSKRREFVKRWAIRLGLAFGALVIIVPLSLFIWGMWEARQLDRELSAMRANGEPTLVSDLDSPILGSNENCVPEFQAAAQIVQQKAVAYKAIDDLNGYFVSVRLPLREDEHKLIRAALDASAKAFPLVDSATTKPSVGLGLKVTSPAFMRLIPNLTDDRALARALSYAAFDAQTNGDIADALRRSGQILSVARMADHDPSLVGHLVAIGETALAAETIADVAADAGRRAEPLSPGARSEARKLIAELLDETDYEEGLRRAFRGERTMTIDAAQSLARGKASAPMAAQLSVNGLFRSRMARGFLLRNGRVINWFYADLLRSLEGTHDAATFRAAYAKQPNNPQRIPKVYVLANILIPSVDRAVTVHFRGEAQRRLAATALAIMLYRADHGGAFPKTLRDLVPGYLPAVPSDPLSKPGATIGYVADQQRPRIYSVGENGVDDGGKAPDEHNRKGKNDRTTDLVVDLLPQTRPLPETRASDEQ